MTIPGLSGIFRPQPPPPTFVEIPFEVKLQTFDNWCWASVTEAVERFFNVQPPRTQCRIVNDVLQVNECCPELTARARICNKPRSPFDSLGPLILRRVDDAEGGTDNSFVFDEIVQRRMPFIANIGYDDARIGHLVVVSGFHFVGPVLKLVVWDPYVGGRNEEPIVPFRTNYRSKGRWRASYQVQSPPSLLDELLEQEGEG